MAGVGGGVVIVASLTKSSIPSKSSNIKYIKQLISR